LLRAAVGGDYRREILAQDPRLRLRMLADASFRVLNDEIKKTEPSKNTHVEIHSYDAFSFSFQLLTLNSKAKTHTHM
jgi:hypothetical protein